MKLGLNLTGESHVDGKDYEDDVLLKYVYWNDAVFTVNCGDFGTFTWA